MTESRLASLILGVAGAVLTALGIAISVTLLLVAWAMGPAYSPPLFQLALASFAFPVVMLAFTISSPRIGHRITSRSRSAQDTAAGRLDAEQAQ